MSATKVVFVEEKVIEKEQEPPRALSEDSGIRRKQRERAEIDWMNS